MNKEILFANALEELKRTAKEQGNCIAQEQIAAAFKEMELSEEQMELVTDYLKKQRIGIGEPVDAEEYLTKEEADYLETYLEELKNLEQVTAGEKEAITLSAMAGDAQAQARLTELYLPEVVEIAKLYGGQGAYLEDLIGEGNLALAVGVGMLGCLEHAHEVQGMLGKMIMDAMEEHIAGSLQEKQTDKYVLDKVNVVADQARELAQVLQRNVTVAELLQEGKLSEEIILEAIRMSGDNIEYIEKQ
ncbi:RNA polymerase primary sigma factor [Kineothrix alysoides]|uniref:RNA polymerase primary sigma factor n=1 Tax=Kineothrix alysoides TaxID=1469948 RepID=A0A4R1R3H6_9FIRM|nr:RNA polymerase sigma factor region1.1 domain-containing protein [Kineothrix alysoides]TCL59991.1 RNA polymerase primary sigma factor [Kineothrix alysoides]